MHVLVTGGCGFIGANLVVALEGAGHAVTVVDVREGHELLSGSAASLVGADVTDAAFWDSIGTGFDAVCHQAACTDTTIADDGLMRAANVETLRRLLDWAERTATGVVYASSAAVYGNTPAPSRIGHGEEPLNAYARSKHEGDGIVRERLARGSAIKLIGLRYFNVYGPGESHKGHMASMATKLAAAMRAGRRPRLFTDGTQRRDHVHVDDVVAANLAALEAPPPSSGIHNIGTGTATTFNTLVDILNDALGTSLEPDYIGEPPQGFQVHTEADIGSAAAALGYRPQVELSAGVGRLVRAL